MIFLSLLDCKLRWWRAAVRCWQDTTTWVQILWDSVWVIGDLRLNWRFVLRCPRLGYWSTCWLRCRIAALNQNGNVPCVWYLAMRIRVCEWCRPLLAALSVRSRAKHRVLSCWWACEDRLDISNRRSFIAAMFFAANLVFESVARAILTKESWGGECISLSVPQGKMGNGEDGSWVSDNWQPCLTWSVFERGMWKTAVSPMKETSEIFMQARSLHRKSPWEAIEILQ